MATEKRTSASSAQSYVAIACWMDLLGYGSEINEAGFDPAHPNAKRPLSRLRAFHRIVSKHSGAGFPTLVMNDGAVAYRNVDLTRSDKIWRFIERCWALFGEASVTDNRNGGPGLRGVISVGLRAKGSNRGIVAQEDAFTKIIDDLVAHKLTRNEAVAAGRRIRREFDIVPQLQANFAFTRAYLAEQAGSRAGLCGPNLFLDVAVFADGPPDWIRHDAPIAWRPEHREALHTSFIAVREIGPVTAEAAPEAFRTGCDLVSLLSST